MTAMMQQPRQLREIPAPATVTEQLHALYGSPYFRPVPDWLGEAMIAHTFTKSQSRTIWLLIKRLFSGHTIKATDQLSAAEAARLINEAGGEEESAQTLTQAFRELKDRGVLLRIQKNSPHIGNAGDVIAFNPAARTWLTQAQIKDGLRYSESGTTGDAPQMAIVPITDRAILPMTESAILPNTEWAKLPTHESLKEEIQEEIQEEKTPPAVAEFGEISQDQRAMLEFERREREETTALLAAQTAAILTPRSHTKTARKSSEIPGVAFRTPIAPRPDELPAEELPVFGVIRQGYKAKYGLDWAENPQELRFVAETATDYPAEVERVWATYFTAITRDAAPVDWFYAFNGISRGNIVAELKRAHADSSYTPWDRTPQARPIPTPRPKPGSNASSRNLSQVRSTADDPRSYDQLLADEGTAVRRR